MVEGDENGGGGPLVPLRKMLGETLQEDEFVFHLVKTRKHGSTTWSPSRKRSYNDINLHFRDNDGILVNLLSRREIRFAIGKDFCEE